MVTRSLTMIGWLFGSMAICYVHDGIYEQLAQVTLQIRQQPNDAALYLRRGELHRLHRDWVAALADFDRAERLNPKLIESELFRGRMWLDAQRPRQAKQSLDRFLKTKPENAEGWLLRARAFEQMKRHRQAAADFTRAIDLMPRAKPDFYVERAQAQMAGGKLAEALRGLDEGMVGLGRIVTLQLPAIEIELQLRRWDDALARLDQLSSQSARKETWLARRGEILLQAGRRSEAHEAFNSALQAIEALPPQWRQIRATQDLEKQLRQRLG